MTTGIIVYSHTGHTLAVARRLAERLSADGQQVRLEQLEVAGPVNLSATTAALKRKPSTAPFHNLMFASPVNGGRLSAAMKSYLDQIPSLEGKRVACLVTHFLLYRWGAKQTLEQMIEACESKGATVCGSGSVRWSSLRRGRQISQAIDGLMRCMAAG